MLKNYIHLSLNIYQYLFYPIVLYITGYRGYDDELIEIPFPTKKIYIFFADIFVFYKYPKRLLFDGNKMIPKLLSKVNLIKT